MTIEDQVSWLMQGTSYGDEKVRWEMARQLGRALERAEAEKRPLRVYAGYDPRTADLHVGHLVTLRKLQQFQTLGHDVTVVLGTFTARVGDPSDKDSVRWSLTAEETESNAQTYVQQSGKVLQLARTTVRRNAEWLEALSLGEMLEIASHSTISQMVTRDAFAKRIASGTPVYLHELLYCLLQGRDAVELRADVQVGGSDQLWNILAGRRLQVVSGQRPMVAIVTRLLPGTDGVRKMSKSLDNHIALNTTPENMYGQIMALPDRVLPDYLDLLGGYAYDPERLRVMQERLSAGGSERSIKADFAERLVTSLFGTAGGTDTGVTARDAFEQQFVRRDVPAGMQEYRLGRWDNHQLDDVLSAAGVVPSKRQVRTLASEGAIHINGERIGDGRMLLDWSLISVIKIGKRRYLRVVPNEGAS